MMRFSRHHHNARKMNSSLREVLMQRWSIVQWELLPDLKEDVGVLTPKLAKLVYVLEWVRIEEFTGSSWVGVGRPLLERAWFANAFVAKTVLGLGTTAGLIERLAIDRALRRICGFSMYGKLPSEATFSRAFDEFAQTRLAERVHEALIKGHLADELIGHISRDGTAIKAREHPVRESATAPASPAPSAQATLFPAPETTPTPVCETAPAPKRGRPRRGETRTPPESALQRQRRQTLAQMIGEIPTACDRGTKCNAQGYKVSWNGYKLHLDTADCGVPVAAILSSASMHDSKAAIPLSLLSAQRVTNLYDVMDAAYCSSDLRAHSRDLGHVPLIDHNPRKGEKIEFDPAQVLSCTLFRDSPACFSLSDSP